MSVAVILCGTDESWSYTSNCAPMWRRAGLNFDAFEGQLARDCEPTVARAVAFLKRWPNFFSTMNPKNGWGSYETLVKHLDQLERLLREHPTAKVSVWQ